MSEYLVDAMENFGYETYLSPFTTRYGSREMRELFSHIRFHEDLRKIWSYLAAAQSHYGLVSEDELADIQAHAGPEYINMERIRELDRKIRHDLMSALRHYAEECKVGGGKLHAGGTSMDIEDNEDVSRLREGSDILVTRAINTLDSMAPHIRNYTDVPCIAWTHLQPAGYTTIGYRFANYAQQLVMALGFLEHVRDEVLKGKGFKGIAGTASGYKILLGDADPAEMEKKVMEKWDSVLFH